MNKSLYEIFSCNSKEELYEKLINNSSDVRHLNEFIDYAKGNIASKETILKSPALIVDRFKAMGVPDKNTAFLLGANVRLQALLTKKINLNDQKEFKEVARDFIKGGVTNFFMAYNDSTSKDFLDKLEKSMDTLCIGLIDSFSVKNKGDNLFYISKETGEDYVFTKPNISEKKQPYKNKTVELNNKATEFFNYYAEKGLKGLDIKEDAEKIKEILKLGYQHEKREVFGCAIYGENNKIIESKILFSGGIENAVADTRVLYDYILSNEKAKGAFVYHNHPSGQINPSMKDGQLTLNIALGARMLGVELHDHLVVGKEGAYSFRENTPIIEYTTNKKMDMVSEPSGNYKKENKTELKTQKENFMDEIFENFKAEKNIRKEMKDYLLANANNLNREIELASHLGSECELLVYSDGSLETRLCGDNSWLQYKTTYYRDDLAGSEIPVLYSWGSEFECSCDWCADYENEFKNEFENKEEFLEECIANNDVYHVDRIIEAIDSLDIGYFDNELVQYKSTNRFDSVKEPISKYGQNAQKENTMNKSQKTDFKKTANNFSKGVNMSQTTKNTTAQVKDTVPVTRIISDKMLELLEKPMLDEHGKAPVPFLPDKNGFCDTKAVKNAVTGWELSGLQQLAAKMYLHERGQGNDNVMTFQEAKTCNTGVRAGERGFYIPAYNPKTNKMFTVRYFSESQVWNKEKLPYVKTNEMRGEPMTEEMESAEPAKYLGNYLKCVRNGRAFKPTPEVAAKFRENLTKELKTNRGNLLKIANEAAKIARPPKAQEKSQEKAKTKTRSQERVAELSR